MPNYRIFLTNGHIQVVEGRRFSSYVQNTQHRFLLHQDHVTRTGWIVSHKPSGRRIGAIPHLTLAAHPGDELAAAKAYLAAAVAQVGEARFRSVLAAAPDLPPDPPRSRRKAKSSEAAEARA